MTKANSQIIHWCYSFYLLEKHIFSACFTKNINCNNYKLVKILYYEKWLNAAVELLRDKVISSPAVVYSAKVLLIKYAPIHTFGFVYTSDLIINLDSSL